MAIFLDEIGELSPLIQLKLLRVLQERIIERVGEADPRIVDVRVIAATHRDLKQMVDDGTFREDLFYRLHVFPIYMPPLRERRSDIPMLVQHFIDRFNVQTGKVIQGIGADALNAMIDSPWRGNVRELENAIEHAFVTCRGDVLELEHLPAELRNGESGFSSTQTHTTSSFTNKRLSQGPRQARTADELRALLDEYGWKRNDVAEAMGISRVTLWRKMKDWGVLET